LERGRKSQPRQRKKKTHKSSLSWPSNSTWHLKSAIRCCTRPRIPSYHLLEKNRHSSRESEITAGPLPHRHVGRITWVAIPGGTGFPLERVSSFPLRKMRYVEYRM